MRLVCCRTWLNFGQEVRPLRYALLRPCVPEETLGGRRPRRLALEHHPDRNTRGVDRMARVNAAYAVLDSPRARRSYDYDLRFGRFDGARRRGAEAAD